MSVINFIVMTPAELATANQGGAGWGNGRVEAGGRLIDNSSPGIGLNLNPDADNFDGGDVVILAGNYVASKQMVDDPEYLLYAADLVAFLKTLPWCMLESETIFAPPEPV